MIFWEGDPVYDYCFNFVPFLALNRTIPVDKRSLEDLYPPT